MSSKSQSGISKIISSLKWVLFVSRRFAHVDRKGASAVTSALASLGICFGVMTLITVISVMNGFQRSFIDSIMEISSCHIRVCDFDEQQEKSLSEFLSSQKNIKSAFPFYEAQSLVVGRDGRETAALLRAVPPSLYDSDPGFKKELNVYGGDFDLSSPNSIVIGSRLASELRLRVGSNLNIFALSGGDDVDLFSSDRVFTVTGIFHSGESTINSSFAFISLDDGKKYFGKGAALQYGIKIKENASVSREIEKIKASFPDARVQSWQDYNRSFFKALKVEKNMLMFLVFLIFVVVAINIFNGMRRMVYERREEISILSAFGGKKNEIQSIFIMQGFLTGFLGAVPGCVLGLLCSVKMDAVFVFMAKITYWCSLFVTMLFNPENGDLIRSNSMFLVYARIPPRIYVHEVLLITIFGIFSSLLASWKASRGVLKMTVAEVMRDE